MKTNYQISKKALKETWEDLVFEIKIAETGERLMFLLYAVWMAASGEWIRLLYDEGHRQGYIEFADMFLGDRGCWCLFGGCGFGGIMLVVLLYLLGLASFAEKYNFYKELELKYVLQRNGNR